MTTEKYIGMSDEDIVNLVLQDKEVFVVLVKRYQDPLLRYLRRIGVTRQEDAEDVLQNVFLKVFRNLNDFDKRLKFSSWIYRITHNEGVSHFRSNNVRQNGVSMEDDKDVMDQIKGGLDLEREMERTLSADLVAFGIAKLDRKYRDVLVLRYLEERSYNEISDILRLPTGSVATLLSRAKSRLKKILTEK